MNLYYLITISILIFTCHTIRFIQSPPVIYEDKNETSSGSLENIEHQNGEALNHNSKQVSGALEEEQMDPMLTYSFQTEEQKQKLMNGLWIVLYFVQFESNLFGDIGKLIDDVIARAEMSYLGGTLNRVFVNISELKGLLSVEEVVSLPILKVYKNGKLIGAIPKDTGNTYTVDGVVSFFHNTKDRIHPIFADKLVSTENSEQKPMHSYLKRLESSYPRMETQGKVYELNGDDFDQVTQNDTWLIKFYTTWCHYCQELIPVWEDLAETLKYTARVGQIDCDKYKETCEKYHVKGYPNIKMWIKGHQIEYHGKRTSESIIESLSSSLKPDLFISAIEYDLLVKKSQSFIIYIYNPFIPSDKSDKNFVQVMGYLSDQRVPFYISSDEGLLERFSSQSQTAEAGPIMIYYCASSGKPIFLPNEFLTSHELTADWVFNQLHTELLEVQYTNARFILAGTRLALLAILDKSQPEQFESLKGQLEKIVHDIRAIDKSYMFGYIDGKEYESYIEKVYGPNMDGLPRWIIIDPAKEKFYELNIPMNSPLNKEMILNTLHEIKRDLYPGKHVVGAFRAIRNKFFKVVQASMDIATMFPIWILIAFCLFGLALVVYCVKKWYDFGSSKPRKE